MRFKTMKFDPCRTSNHIHERCLHFEEAHVVKELSDVRDDFGSRDEHLPHLFINDQVKVSLSEPRFLKQINSNFIVRCIWLSHVQKADSAN